MDSEILSVISLLKRTFEKDAWHGPAVMEALADLPEAHAWKKLPHTHSIIELVAHMTAWRTYVFKKLIGDSDYKVSDEMNFPAASSWPETMKRLKESQDDLLTALEKFPAEQLHVTVPGAAPGTTYYMLVHGIIHHDLYHTGQILLMKKAFS